MSNVVIVGLILIVIAGGLYVLTNTMSDNTAGTLSAVDLQKEAMKKDQLAKDEMAKKVVADKIAADAKVGVMVGGMMMLPTLDIVENALKASNLTTVVAALKAAVLVDTLKGTGPFTVFAPNDAAFASLATGTVDTLLKVENKAKLTNILTYHVVPGRYLAANLTDGQKLKTVQGQEITITKKDNKIMINSSANVETADVISSNGVTFIIDTVLMPK